MDEGHSEEVEAWRRRIYRRYGAEALHLAQAVQSGVLVHLKAQLERSGLAEADVDGVLRDVFEDIDRYVRFIQTDDDPDTGANACHAILSAHRPRVFAVAGSGDARDIAGETAKMLTSMVKDYDVSRILEEASATLFFVFRRA